VAELVELTGTAPDGYPVHGWLVLPAGEGPHPVLLDVHGGPHHAYSWGIFDEAQVYAGAGYAVVLPNPRGSAGYGQAHGRAVIGRLGTIDADDVLALLDAAVARPDCDGDRVGVMGGSYGGFMTSWLASHAPERFVAGISERAVNAWDSFSGSSDIGYYFADSYLGEDPAALWPTSPLAHADSIGIPLLIMHSEQDWRCPLEQAQRLFVALKRRGAPVEMLIFPGEGHELSRSGRPQHRVQRFQAILDWWQRHLPVGAENSH
jgi:dipeptidyl aminopeptidase/acylaminoacyl peptidase